MLKDGRCGIARIALGAEPSKAQVRTLSAYPHSIYVTAGRAVDMITISRSVCSFVDPAMHSTWIHASEQPDAGKPYKKHQRNWVLIGSLGIGG